AAPAAGAGVRLGTGGRSAPGGGVIRGGRVASGARRLRTGGGPSASTGARPRRHGRVHHARGWGDCGRPWTLGGATYADAERADADTLRGARPVGQPVAGSI